MSRAAARRLLAGAAHEVAPRLLGAVLESRVGGDPVAVRITEVEAYAGVGGDPASHAHRGRTRRNAAMFGHPGHAYVYFTYGMHWCLNVVTGTEGDAAAVLVRAGEVVRGVDAARRRRPAARTDRDLARGPARLAAALGVTADLDGADLLGDGPLTLAVGAPPAAARVRTGPRVGVRGGATTPWRYWLADEPTVSAYRPASQRPRR
ncbi:MAG: DNA-3-methyladenine glycosylase [Candidatus Nanopelagicales bacterium]